MDAVCFDPATRVFENLEDDLIGKGRSCGHRGREALVKGEVGLMRGPCAGSRWWRSCRVRRGSVRSVEKSTKAASSRRENRGH